MKYLEYKLVSLDYQGVSYLEVMERKINELAKDGWELVTVSKFGLYETYIAFFKRVAARSQKGKKDPVNPFDDINIGAG